MAQNAQVHTVAREMRLLACRTITKNPAARAQRVVFRRRLEEMKSLGPQIFEPRRHARLA